ncbi:hypothetical protein HMPREF1139_1468 [Campylobacter sp. FOBRC14]|nr:hypothetical protein HMPREF1139_1468 [Campylobacter sp. FOBRC14]
MRHGTAKSLAIVHPLLLRPLKLVSLSGLAKYLKFYTFG